MYSRSTLSYFGNLCKKLFEFRHFAFTKLDRGRDKSFEVVIRLPAVIVTDTDAKDQTDPKDGNVPPTNVEQT